MSHEIIYKAFTIKKGKKYYPLLISGSNNVGGFNPYTGYNRRERNLNFPYNWFGDQFSFNSIDEMKEKFNWKEVESGIEERDYQGSYKTAKGLLRSFQNNILDYKECDESFFYKLCLNFNIKEQINKKIKEIM